jgi:hypothetical protein
LFPVRLSLQLKKSLQDGHFSLSQAEAEQLLEQVDTLHRGEIDFAEWAAAMADWRSVSRHPKSGCLLLLFAAAPVAAAAHTP